VSCVRGVVIVCLVGFTAAFAGSQAIASSPVATTAHTISCLHQHHVLADDQGVARAAGFHGGEWIHFTFVGIPTNALDAGAVIIESSHSTAAAAAKKAYRYLYAYDLKHVNGDTPAYLRMVLPQILRVVGNAVELWNSAPVSKAASRIMSGCLAS
jgi:hypothetical protein